MTARHAASHYPLKDALSDGLSKSQEITIGVTGRKSGRNISLPIWFVAEGDKVYLLPVKGSDTQWYKNLLNSPTIRISVRGAEAEFKAIPITDAAEVSSVVGRFRGKYGAGDVKKYYSKFDVAVLAEKK
jgi:deazaflavin-dependent oxidoreductase (nitroreductase family)